MFVFPYRLAGLCILALLGLEDLLSDGHSNWAVHLTEGASTTCKLCGFEAEIDYIAFLLLESSRKGNESYLLSIKIEEASKIDLLRLSKHSLSWRRFWAFYLQGIEVGIKVDNSISD